MSGLLCTCSRVVVTWIRSPSQSTGRTIVGADVAIGRVDAQARDRVHVSQRARHALMISFVPVLRTAARGGRNG
ncbi:MAG: hypothetical protein DMD87_29525 [Candidatus Rokuibacteriota bacterium]|nr:MAG: hypothetical protein DMD87_29525 [Candidatus Rokubacteria bacterium]